MSKTINGFVAKLVPINLFGIATKMFVYDYDYYITSGIGGEGKDIISKCLYGKDNCWEPYQTEITKELLKDGDNVFVDVGCHLGWYSLLSAQYNNHTYSIDANKTALDFLEASINENNAKNITLTKMFVNKNFDLDKLVGKDRYVKLMKADLEGGEVDFVESIMPQLQNKRVENLILEITPKFRSDYHTCILKLKGLGYNVYDIGLSPQRQLDPNMSLSSLRSRIIDTADPEKLKKYITDLKSGQSNFLISLNTF